ncbi:hypothetical protein [Halobacterium sp. CBA1126]|nr:hypothetical protein [Halobacterium sp. CBA1126]MUV61824.1 hypothetical protein [Halobacterium sp. CBA1126]
MTQPAAHTTRSTVVSRAAGEPAVGVDGTLDRAASSRRVPRRPGSS